MNIQARKCQEGKITEREIETSSPGATAHRWWGVGGAGELARSGGEMVRNRNVFGRCHCALAVKVEEAGELDWIEEEWERDGEK